MGVYVTIGVWDGRMALHPTWDEVDFGPLFSGSLPELNEIEITVKEPSAYLQHGRLRPYEESLH
ncbi:hypothetical protein N7535_000792 [Penicillium sp. DV-2018c]|nr:hypothetical protein N7461_005960 [Penicillium sp. DV-2018c]KAJ5582172.1 hypothetical protein N7535_000792 [Penicillium sp. DV-2018c]